MNPTILGVIGPGFLNQAPTLGQSYWRERVPNGEHPQACKCTPEEPSKAGWLYALPVAERHLYVDTNYTFNPVNTLKPELRR